MDTIEFRNLPAVVRAELPNVRLPDNYKRAIAAIEECYNIDECAEWSNKAAMAASYYKQAGDMKMEYVSQRIRLRARLKCAELIRILSEDESYAVQKRIGMRDSEKSQLNDALKVERPTREALIDATPPATLRKLARIGNPPPIYTPQPGTGNAPGFAAILAMWKVCKRTDGAEEGALIDKSDAAYVRQMLADIDSWVHEFERTMPKSRTLKKA